MVRIGKAIGYAQRANSLRWSFYILHVKSDVKLPKVYNVSPHSQHVDVLTYLPTD